METLDNNPQEKEKVRICPVCKQEILIKSGMQNWKKLFRKPTFDEWITLLLILGVIVIYFMYQHDIQQYQDYINRSCGVDSSLKESIFQNYTKPIDNITSIVYTNKINQSSNDG